MTNGTLIVTRLIHSAIVAAPAPMCNVAIVFAMYVNKIEWKSEYVKIRKQNQLQKMLTTKQTTK